MPVPVFEQPMIKEQPAETKPAKEKLSGMAIFFGILMVAVLVIASESAFRDFNRLSNPYYSPCHTVGSSLLNLGKAPKIPANCNLLKFEQSRLLLHADIVLPLAVIGILMFILLRKKKIPGAARILLTACCIFVIWLIGRLAVEAEYFMVKNYPLEGKYIVLLSIAFLIALGAILIQRRAKAK